MMRTQISRYKKSSVYSLPRSQEIVKPQLVINTLPIAQTKSNEEGLSEWEAQRQKWARMGTPWMNKVPNVKEDLAQPWVQRKLTIGEAGDKYEQEADLAAKQIVQHMHAPFSGNSPHPNLPADKAVKRRPEKNLIVQRLSARKSRAVSPELEASIQQARSGGRPLDKSIRQSMEQSFGANFNGVRVHTNAQADRLNRSLLSRAFTTKQDVFFKRGEYQPSSRGGQELIAHELTHVVQQNGSVVRRWPITQPQFPNRTTIGHLSTSASHGEILIQAGGQLGKQARRLENSISQPDETGGGIWLTETNAAQGKHQQVRIGKIKKEAYAQSYGLKEAPESELEMLNPSVSTGPSEQGTGKAIVYEDKSKPTKTVQFFPMTEEEQSKAIETLKKEVGQEGQYSLLTYNCVHYSKSKFDQIKYDTMQSRSSEGSDTIPSLPFDYRFDYDF